MANGENTTPAERGTVLWAFNRMKSDALPALMDDLLSAQSDGITEEQCDNIKNAIGKMVHVATAIPDGHLFSAPIWEVMQKLEKTYKSWNTPKGGGPDNEKHREQQLEALRKLRHKIAKKTRRHGHVLAENLDLQLIDEAYGALGKVARSGPGVFTSLAKAIERFSKRMGGD